MNPPERPECPMCGEELPTDYLGRLDKKRAHLHMCNLPSDPVFPFPWLRFILFCSIMALLGVVLAKCAFGQTVQVRPEYVINGDRALLIKGKTAGSVNVWMTLEAHNGAQWIDDGFNPSYTRLICDYKPMFRKLPTGQWEIMFTSEIAENLP